MDDPAGRQLIADADGRFVVQLSEPASAGYRWTPVGLAPGMRLEEDKVISHDIALGGGRRRAFRLVASKAGRYQLDFELRRPWEEHAVKRYQVLVQVGP